MNINQNVSSSPSFGAMLGGKKIIQQLSKGSNAENLKSVIENQSKNNAADIFIGENGSVSVIDRNNSKIIKPTGNVVFADEYVLSPRNSSKAQLNYEASKPRNSHVLENGAYYSTDAFKRVLQPDGKNNAMISKLNAAIDIADDIKAKSELNNQNTKKSLVKKIGEFFTA